MLTRVKGRWTLESPEGLLPIREVWQNRWSSGVALQLVEKLEPRKFLSPGEELGNPEAAEALQFAQLEQTAGKLTWEQLPSRLTAAEALEPATRPESLVEYPNRRRAVAEAAGLRERRSASPGQAASTVAVAAAAPPGDHAPARAGTGHPGRRSTQPGPDRRDPRCGPSRSRGGSGRGRTAAARQATGQRAGADSAERPVRLVALRQLVG